MTNQTQHSKAPVTQPAKATQTKHKTKKKPESFMLLKSSIMVFSIAGTMGGWLIFLDQESNSQPTVTELSATELSTITEPASQVLQTNQAMQNSQMQQASYGSAPSTPEVTLVDINELRQVNQALPQPTMQRAVVTRTRSSQ